MHDVDAGQFQAVIVSGLYTYRSNLQKNPLIRYNTKPKVRIFAHAH